MNKRDLFKMLAGAGFAVGTTKALARESHAPDLTPVRADDVPPQVINVLPKRTPRVVKYWAEVKIHMDDTVLQFNANLVEVSASTHYDTIEVTSWDDSTRRHLTGLQQQEVTMRMLPIGEIEMS